MNMNLKRFDPYPPLASLNRLAASRPLRLVLSVGFILGLALAVAEASWVLPSNYHKALELAGRAQYDEAIELLKKHVPEDSAFAEAFIRLAEFYRYAGRLSTGREYFEAQLEHHPNHPNLHLGLALIARWSGAWQEAYDHSKAALQSGSTVPLAVEVLVQAATEANHYGELQAVWRRLGRSATQAHFRNLGNALQRLARDDHRRARTWATRYVNERPNDWFARALYAQLATESGRTEEAQRAWYEAWRLVRTEDPHDKITVLTGLGQFFATVGYADSAIYCLEDATQRAQNIGALDEQIDVFQRLSHLYMAEASYLKVVDVCKQALRLAGQLGLQGRLAELHFTLAEAYARMANRYAAITNFRRSIEQAGHTGETALRVRAYLGLAQEFITLQQLTEALQALKIGYALADGKGLAETKFDLRLVMGDVHRALNNADQAKACYQEVLRYARAGSRDALIENCYLRLVQLYLDLYDDIDSAKYYLRLADAFALPNIQLRFMANHRWLQGEIARMEGYFEDAETLFIDAINLGKQTATYMPVLAGMAGLVRTYLDVERPDLAATQADSAVTCLMQHRNLIVQEDAWAIFDLQEDLIFPAVTAYARENNLVRIYELCEQTKAYKHSDAMAELKFISNALMPKPMQQRLLSLIEQIEKKRQEIAEMWRSKMADDHSKVLQIKTEMNDLLRAKDRLRREIAEQYPEYVSLFSLTGESLARVAERLRTLEASLVHYLVGDSQTVALVVRPDALFFYPIDISRKQLVETIAAVHPMFAAPGSNGAVRAGDGTTDFRLDALGRLHKLLVAPIESALSPNSHVIISPDGPLNNVPFECLVKNARELVGPYDYQQAKFLIEDYPVSYVPTARMLLSPESRRGSERRLIAVANVSVGQAAEPANASGNHRMVPAQESSLPQSLVHGVEEVRSVATTLDIPESDVHLDPDVARAEFLQDLRRYQFIHLAVPALLDDHQPLHSRILLSQAEPPLETHKLFDLQLTADLVTVSRCWHRTGLVYNGEALTALGYGCILGGARSLLANLWPPAKAQTGILTSFYEHLRDGLDKAAALSEAKRQYLASADRNPFYWATFRLIGDPESVVLTSAGLPPAARLALVVLVLLVGVIMWTVYVHYRGAGGD